MGRVVIFLLMLLSTPITARSQASYNSCSSALELCPGQPVGANNVDANVTFCNDCEDDFTPCFTLENSVWFTFTTNATGGDIQLDISNILFQGGVGSGSALQATIIQAAIACDAATYTSVGNCINNGVAPFSLNAVGLPSNTTYYIVVDGDDAGGTLNPAEATFNIQISGTAIYRPAPSLNLTQSSASVCLNELVQFIVSPIDCPNSNSYNWYINGALAAVTSDTTYQTSDLQNGDVVTVETACYTLCPDTISNDYVQMAIYSFNIDAGSDQTIEEGETTQLFGATSAPDFIWTPSFYLSADNILNPIATPDETVTYTLSATENGCTLFDYVTITVNSGLQIPNTFSPNNDANNDTWVIQGIEKHPNCLVQVYTRWGQKVFQATGYSESKAWDGTNGKGEAAVGVYYYIIKLRDGSDEVLKGSLTVLR
jgi:gliding motility-associated-like protein